MFAGCEINHNPGTPCPACGIEDCEVIHVYCNTCKKHDCKIDHSKPAFILGRVRGNDTPIGIGDAVEILMYLAKMPQSVIAQDETGRAKAAATIAPGAKEPSIGCAVQILMYLADMPQSVLKNPPPAVVAGALPPAPPQFFEKN